MIHYEYLWNSPPLTSEIGLNDVHVWRACLNPPKWQIQKFEASLSSDEKARAAKFVFGKHQRRFIVGRGLLRKLLGNYLHTEPARIEFNYGQWGKPELAVGAINDKLCFNLSHSKEVALYAVALNRAIGIDVEYQYRHPDAEQLAKRFFFESEVDVIRLLSSHRKQEAFIKCWTVKEAYLKATGDGLKDLDQVEVSLSPDNPSELLSIRGIPSQETCWTSRQFNPLPGYTAALVVQGREWRLSNFAS